MQRFLIVDDNAIERALYHMIISYHFDCSHIDFAVNGVEALEESLKNDYSAIIADIEMPRMNGIDFFKRLKINSPQKAEKVIFASANIENHKKTFFNRENCPYLVKPFSRIELLHLINNTIEGKKE